MKVKIDTHVHSIASGHAFNTINEIMTFANRKNMELVCITEHGPSMKGAPHTEYFEMVAEVPLKFDNCICLMGCECNIIDQHGHLDLDDKFLKDLDVVLIGLDRLTPYPEHSTKEMNTSAVINAMKNPYADIVAHPYRENFPVDIEVVVKAAAQYKCMLELNCRIFSKASNVDALTEVYSKMLKLCVEYGVPVVIGTDAHIAFGIGDASSLNPVKKSIDIQNEIIVNTSKAFVKLLLRKRNRVKINEVIKNNTLL